MNNEAIKKRISILESERDDCEERGFGFSVFQIEEEIEQLERSL